MFANIVIALQTTVAIFIMFIANTLTNARFFPVLLGPLYDALPTMFLRMLVLGLPIYAIGILMIADAFARNAVLTGPTLLFANVIAAVVTSMALDGVKVNAYIIAAVIMCLVAELFLFMAMNGNK